MKLQIVSDLHLEFLSDKQVVEVANRISNDSPAEVLILAGDICSLSERSVNKFTTFIDEIKDSYLKIIYVSGNHEYYGTSRQEIHELGHKIIKYRSNLHLLENKSITINNITFYGTTLWFEETVEAGTKRNYLNDYRYIQNFQPDLWSKKAIKFIKSIPNDPTKKVLITHHVPHSRFISPKYVGSDMNCFYINEIGKYLGKFDLVTFGHSHDSVNQQFSERTLAISNPRGYVNSGNEGENDKFEYQLIVEV
jgi:predicted phosphodiesterase